MTFEQPLYMLINQCTAPMTVYPLYPVPAKQKDQLSFVLYMTLK